MAGRQRGFTLIELMIVLAIIAIIAAIAIPNLLAARKSGNEASAIGSLKTMATAESLFREGDKENDGNLDYGMLSELNLVNLVDPVFGSGTKHNYIFLVGYSLTSSEFLWFGAGNPALATVTGDRYFAINQAGVVYYTTGTSVALDQSSCTLPNMGLLPVGK